MLFKCSNIVQSRFLLQVEPCKGKVFKCISVAALSTTDPGAEQQISPNASTTARFERDVDIFFRSMFSIVLLHLLGLGQCKRPGLGVHR